MNNLNSTLNSINTGSSIPLVEPSRNEHKRPFQQVNSDQEINSDQENVQSNKALKIGTETVEPNEPKNLPASSIKLVPTNSVPPIVTRINQVNPVNSNTSTQASLPNVPSNEVLEQQKIRHMQLRQCVQNFCYLLKSWDPQHPSLPKNLVQAFIELNNYKVINLRPSYVGLSDGLCNLFSEAEWTKIFSFLSMLKKETSHQYQNEALKNSIAQTISNPICLNLGSLKNLTSHNLRQLSQFQQLKLYVDWKMWNSPYNKFNDLTFSFGEKKLFICRSLIEKDLASFLGQFDPAATDIDLTNSSINYEEFEKLLKIIYGIPFPELIEVAEAISLAKLLLKIPSNCGLQYFKRLQLKNIANVTEEQINELKNLIAQHPLDNTNQSGVINHLKLFFNQIFEEIINKFSKKPFLYFQYGNLIEKCGSHLTSLNIDLRGGLSSCISKLFPNVDDFTFQSLAEGEKPLATVLENIEPRVETLNIRFNPADFFFANLESCSKLSSFSLGDKVEEPGWVEVQPFENPEKMTNLETLELIRVDLSNRDVLNSIAKLPNLKDLYLYACKNIDLATLEELLLPKLTNFALEDPCFYEEVNSWYGSEEKKVEKLSWQRLWKWQKQFPHFSLDQCFESEESLQKRWNRDSTDFVQAIQSSSPQTQQNTSIVRFNEIIDGNKKEQFVSLINQLGEEEIKVFDCLEAKEHLNKMRYSNILFYDHNHLNQQLGFVFNASPIKGINGKMRIATQGPTDQTIGDFWEAIWTMKTNCIVMLTACQELGREKCATYWPTSLHETLTCKSPNGQYIEVTFQAEKPFLIGKIREFNIKTTEGTHTVEQLHIDQWNDQTALSIQILSQLVNGIYQIESQAKTPIVTHCSAGVGRTGVILACLMIKDILPKLLEQTKDKDGKLHPENLQLDIEKLLITLRQQRMGMIQTADQLISVIEFFKVELKNLVDQHININ